MAASASSSSTPLQPPALTPDIVQHAHKLIDLAKAGRWADLFKMLEVHKTLVNVRPDVREFALLHQAAYQGREEVVVRLIDECGADPAQRTKSGQSVAEVAEEQGFSAVAKKVCARLPKSISVAGA